MNGGAGSDTYFVDNAGDTTVETIGGAAGGTDLVNASVNRTLGANLENLVMFGVATTGTGNGLAGNDILIGGAGPDILIGGLNNDTFVYNALSNRRSARPTASGRSAERSRSRESVARPATAST